MDRNIKKVVGIILTGICFLLSNAQVVRSDELCPLDAKIKKARVELMNKYKDAIVVVRLVVKTKTSVGGREMDKGREQKIEATGTMLDPSGLVLISNSQIDRSSDYDTSYYEEMGMGKYKVDSSITDIKIVLNDGKELPASIVLKDKDLDIAFIRPNEKGLQLTYLQLAKTKAPEVFDRIISIYRYDFSTGREASSYQSEISAIIKKPRTCYVGGGQLGLPVFNLDKECLGISLKRQAAQKAGGYYSMNQVWSAILPSEDILDVMKQVPVSKEK